MSGDNSISKGFFYGASRIFSFFITATIGGFLGLSITKHTITAVLFAIFGGLVGNYIFVAWWKGMKSTSVGRTFKALIFTLFTILIMVGIIFVALGKI